MAVPPAGSTVNARCVAAPGRMLNAVLACPDTPVAAAVSVYPVPLLSMDRLEKVAIPAVAATVRVPESAPPAGFVPIATVTVPVNPVAVLPKASRAVTCTAGVIAVPAVVATGCTVKTSCAALAGVMLNAVLAAAPVPLAVALSVYPTPALSTLKPGKPATPATAARDTVPDSDPPPALLPMAMVTVPVKVVTVLPRLSCAVTCTAGVIALPAAVFPGWTVNTSRVAAAAVTANPMLVVTASPVLDAVSVYPVPVLSMFSVPNVATPLTAACVVVPDSVPPPALLPIATVTLPVNPLAVLPNWSRAVICTAGVMGAPAGTSVGCTVKASCFAAAGVIANGPLVVVSPVADAVSVYPLPTLSMLNVENDATPFTAAMVTVPESVPPPALLAMETVTLPVKLVIVLPSASCALTCTAGVMAAPATALLG